LLLALPKSYETVVTVLENLPAGDINLDFIKAGLRTEAEKRKEISGSQDEIKPTFAFVSNKSLSCYNCKHEHFKKNCRRPIQDQRSYGRNRGNTYHSGNRGGIIRGSTYWGDMNRDSRNRGGGNIEARPRYQRGENYQSHSRYGQNRDTRRGN
jgi:hypothetical protein